MFQARTAPIAGEGGKGYARKSNLRAFSFIIDLSGIIVFFYIDKFLHESINTYIFDIPSRR
jgi:hypothetical protein